MKSKIACSKLFLFALILTLSACGTVGPEYKVPEQSVIQRPTAAAPFIGAGEATYTSEPLPVNWWRLYDEPILDNLIQQALSANSDLKVAAANIAKARAVAQEMKDLNDPSISVNAAPGVGRPSAAARGLAKALPNNWNYDTGVNVSYQADLFGKIARATEAANDDAQAAQAAYDLVKITVVADTVRAYTDACSAVRQIAVTQNSIDLQKKMVDLIQKRIQVGRGMSIESTRALSQLALLGSNLPPLQSQHRIAYYKLAVLTGKTPHEMDLNLLQCHEAPRLSSQIPVGNGAALLRRRPDIRQAERNLAATTARIGVSMADLYPNISFGMSVGSTGLLDHFGAANAFRWNIGPLISWSIPSPAAHSRVREAEASSESALAHFDSVVLNALKEVESALVIYARESERNAALKVARDENARASQQMRQLFEHGRIDFLSVLDTDRNLAAAETALAASDAQLTNDQITLFLALGGGNS